MRNYFRLVIGVLLMMGGCSFTTDYFSDSKRGELNERIANYQKLVDAPIEVTAILDSVYKETTVKVMGVPIKTYETKYFFNVDERMYTGIYKPTSPPDVPILSIQYLKEDPSINSSDPQKELASLKEQKTSKSSLYIGLVLLVIGGGMAYMNFTIIRQRKRDEEAETLRSIAEFNRKKGLS